jgi:lysine-ketoglutarate reductase/saccharopine dehydrogenase-like protein (TIGR00300 family)
MADKAVQQETGDLPYQEIVEVSGHIIDSLLLPKIMDEILTHGGVYELQQIDVGHRPNDPSYARIKVQAHTAAELEAILELIHDHGATPLNQDDCTIEPADMDAAFPETFYSTTNHRTQVRWQGQWMDVQDQEMDCGLTLDPATGVARCIPMLDVKKGLPLVVGHRGIRVLMHEASTRKGLFEFMTSAVSSEKPKGVTVREIASAMRRTKAAGQKILAVLGPAVVHTGGVEHISEMIRLKYLDILFAGNALATHDIEQSMFGTSLGISMDRGLPAEEGHEHHLRAINKVRRAGSIKNAVEKGIIKSGIMYECVKHNIPFVLGGSVRDDGPLPDVITDVIKAQDAMRQHVRNNVGFCLMVATALHSIATGNLLPAWVKVACIDINPATVTKLMDRGSMQTVGIVTDVEPFLREIVAELRKGSDA